jgi:hypothetical protein
MYWYGSGPPEGVVIEPGRRPFVIADPRAAHGPGIGGSKADSEIGVVLKAGNPCYYISFFSAPTPGQTVPDIAQAEAALLEKLAALHPGADGRPWVVAKECLPKLIQGGLQLVERTAENFPQYQKNLAEETGIKLRKRSTQLKKSKAVLLKARTLANAS